MSLSTVSKMYWKYQKYRYLLWSKMALALALPLGMLFLPFKKYLMLCSY